MIHNFKALQRMIPKFFHPHWFAPRSQWCIDKGTEWRSTLPTLDDFSGDNRAKIIVNDRDILRFLHVKPTWLNQGVALTELLHLVTT